MRSDPCDVRTSRLGDVGNNQNSSKAPVCAICPNNYSSVQFDGPLLSVARYTPTMWRQHTEVDCNPIGVGGPYAVSSMPA